MYARTEIDALETKKSSLTCGCIHWHASLHLKWQIKSRQEQKHLSPPKCAVKSHRKLYRMTGWKYGNVETESKHVMKLAYFTTHLWFFLKNLSLAFFCYSFSRKTFSSPMNSEKTITDLEHVWTFWRDYREQKPHSKHEFTPNHIPKSASWPRYTREEQHLESARGRCRGASSSGELVKRVSF